MSAFALAGPATGGEIRRCRGVGTRSKSLDLRDRQRGQDSGSSLERWEIESNRSGEREKFQDRCITNYATPPWAVL